MPITKFAALVAVLLLALPLAAEGQHAGKPVVGFLAAGTPTGWAHVVAAFNEGLKKKGYTDGDNITIEYRWAEGKFDRLPALAAELVP